MHCGVNRTTQSGRVAGPDRRVSREGELKAVTLGAARSLQLEKEIGSIVPGKLANFTILADNPVTCDATKIKDIAVVSTVHEGRVFTATAGEARTTTSHRVPENFKPVAGIPVLDEHSHSHDDGGCSNSSGKIFASLMFPAGDVIPPRAPFVLDATAGLRLAERLSELRRPPHETPLASPARRRRPGWHRHGAVQLP